MILLYGYLNTPAGHRRKYPRYFHDDPHPAVDLWNKINGTIKIIKHNAFHKISKYFLNFCIDVKHSQCDTFPSISLSP